MRTIAHRGCAEQFPENTVRAMESVADHVDMVELDVRRCASGELVVIHDATVDRVTDRTGHVADLTYDELAACDVLGTGDGVPTLNDVCEAVPASVGLNVELKEPRLAADVADTLADYPNDAVVSSFLPGALAELRDAAPDVPRALLFDDGVERPLDVAADLDCAAVHPSVQQCVSTPVVSQAHDREFEVNAWTVRTVADAEQLAARGVDGVIADRRDLF
ncbi:glycerophosphodiester phosphodiesterase [Halarchaeum sp. P4]|uniref:glycerophosphodiester phosphodiesterase n=1 Tax=Halarchaeum sp. P4 TaxID=3421639 RepID=UPI003EB8EBC3